MAGAAIASRVEAGLLKAQGALGPAVPVVLVQKGAAGGDAFNPTPGSNTEYQCVAVQTALNQDDLANTAVATAERVLLVGASSLSVRPTTADCITIDGAAFQVMEVRALEPAGVPLMWRLYLKKG